jgi:DNA adenine methylase
MFEPAVKWSGSKRSQAEEIIKLFPKEIDTYYEPFCGGCSVLRRLLSSDIKVNKYVCSDLNCDLINLWNLIKEEPIELYEHYLKLWNELNKNENKDRKRSYFNEIREKYNKEHDAKDFLFIMRTTTNGMPRYNKNGEFNNSFHITRNGIVPKTLKGVLLEWSELLLSNNVKFVCRSFEEVHSEENDVLYLDPPYFNTKGMYYGKIDFDLFFKWLKEQKGKYYLSFDGKSGEVDNTYKVPEDLYTEHKYLLSGNSSFKRTIGKDKNAIVQESLYIK